MTSWHQRPRFTGNDFAAVCISSGGYAFLLAVACFTGDSDTLKGLAIVGLFVATGQSMMAEFHRRRAAYYRSQVLRALRRHEPADLHDLFSDN